MYRREKPIEDAKNEAEGEHEDGASVWGCLLKRFAWTLRRWQFYQNGEAFSHENNITELLHLKGPEKKFSETAPKLALAWVLAG